MRPDELMIGDWVYNKHHKKNIRLTAYDFVTHSHDERGYQHILPPVKPVLGLDIEPIPLTEAILEKNGFENIGNCYGELKIGEYRIMCDARNIAILHNEHVDVDVPVEFVHELQHVLSICRIEKKIEL